MKLRPRIGACPGPPLHVMEATEVFHWRNTCILQPSFYSLCGGFNQFLDAWFLAWKFFVQHQYSCNPPSESSEAICELRCGTLSNYHRCTYRHLIYAMIVLTKNVNFSRSDGPKILSLVVAPYESVEHSCVTTSSAICQREIIETNTTLAIG